jgi:hypothetical protein
MSSSSHAQSSIPVHRNLTEQTSSSVTASKPKASRTNGSDKKRFSTQIRKTAAERSGQGAAATKLEGATTKKRFALKRLLRKSTNGGGRKNESVNYNQRDPLGEEILTLLLRSNQNGRLYRSSNTDDDDQRLSSNMAMEAHSFSS